MADLPKVLIIDDEEKILTVAKKVLAKENYQVLTSNEVENALMVIDSGPISMVLIDNRMPTMQETELFEKIKVHSPETSRTYDHPYLPSPG